MDIQAKIWSGYAKAASRIGLTYNHYRPTGAANPTGAGNLLGTVVAAFDDNSNYQFQKPNLYGHPEKFVLVDGSLVRPGDYIIGNGDTFFVADLPRLLPIPAMQCNVTIDVMRPASSDGYGEQPYGGDAVADEVPIMSQWPAWIDQGTKGERGDTHLPGDVRMGWYRVLLPAWAGAVIDAFDVINDNLGRRYKVSSAELSPLGWRLTAMLAQT